MADFLIDASAVYIFAIFNALLAPGFFWIAIVFLALAPDVPVLVIIAASLAWLLRVA